jgi:hypothetical protein
MGDKLPAFPQAFDGSRIRQGDYLNAYSRKFGDALSFGNNPAAVPTAGAWSGGIRAERRFMLAALTHYHAVLHYQGKHAGAGLQLYQAGNGGYTESLAGLSYSRDLGQIRLGAQFNYHRLSIAGYGTGATYSADLAVLWQLTGKLQAGIQVLNPVPVSFGPDKSERFTSVYKLGVGYDVSDAFFVAAELSKESRSPADLQVAMYYQFASKFFIRLGINTDVGRPAAALGWEWKNIRLFLTGSYHSQLGMSPGLIMLFTNSKTEKPPPG